MDATALQNETRLVAGALAHLVRHMTTGCPRAAELAALLLARVAEDSDVDPHLRAHARELVDILERDRSADGRRLTATAGKPADRMAH